jgi:hypothetical protein
MDAHVHGNGDADGYADTECDGYTDGNKHMDGYGDAHAYGNADSDAAVDADPHCHPRNCPAGAYRHARAGARIHYFRR